MTSNYDILIQKLDAFIRKYYKNQLIRGALYSAGALLSFFLLLTLLEYLAWLPGKARAVLFFTYLAGALVILYRWVLLPLAHLYRFGRRISHAQAAEIIGKHFANVQDKLINVLQLKLIGEEGSAMSRSLIEASIEQKTEELRPIPFPSAIDLRANRKYLKYALVPLGVVLILLFASPTVIRDPAERLVKYNTFYEKQLPYSLEILNEGLAVVQQEDFLLEVAVKGDETPGLVYVETSEGRYRMVKDDAVNFHYRFRNVQKDISFRLATEQMSTREHILKVLPKPIILSFSTIVDYPGYTGRADEVLDNTGDLSVPEGTMVRWKFQIRDAESLRLLLGNKPSELLPEGGSVSSERLRVMENIEYSVSVRNSWMVSPDSLEYRILAIPDAWPQIMVEEYRDSVFDRRLYFRGMTKDDYGFKRLEFHAQRSSEAGEPIGEEEITLLPLAGGSTQEQFYHFLDMATYSLGPGEELSYFFEVWDNDGVNGSKSARTQKRVYRAPTREEVSKAYDEATERVQEGMGDMLQETRRMMEEIEALRKEMLQKESLNWQDRKKIEDLLKKEKSLEEQFRELMQQNEQKLQKEEQYREVDERLMQKQQELEKLFNEVFDDEMKKMFEELRKMLEEVDRDKVNEMMEKMKMSSEEMEKELDRNLELFKQLEFEKKLEETVDRMEELARKQEELQKETEQGAKKEDELGKEQDKLNKEFDELSKDLKDLEKQNQELEDPFNMQNTGQEQQEIKEEMQQSSDNLQKGKKGKASQNQKNAAQKMDKLAEKLNAMQEQMQQESLGEDIESLRMILENLVDVSFDQERLMNEVAEVKTADPRYIRKMDEQKKIRDDLKMIEDSLFALSKRQVAIQSFVNKEIAEIESELDKALTALEARNKREAAARQQLVMTSVNDLALMLSESMNQMQQQMQQGKSGDGSCQKPGASGQGKGMKSMRQLQEQLNKQMQEMKDGMEKGMKPGSKPGQQGWSEQLARMAAQQEALRRQMEEYREQLNKEGLGNDGELKKMIQEMEQTETDLVNKLLTRETLKRQQEIVQRMLRSEKAEQEREKEEKRESNEAKGVFLRNPEEFSAYKRIKSREIELLRTIPPALSPYYRTKVSEYFYNFGEEK